VIDIRGKSIKLGFTFPQTASVLRREIYERIQEENRAAALGEEALAELLNSRKAQQTKGAKKND
jgi:carbon storage regulator